MPRKKIFIYDTTLRDGAQGAKVSFTLEDKLIIAKKLADLGVDYIEGGWPNQSDFKSVEFFKKIKKVNLSQAKLAAFGSTRAPNTDVEKDSTIQYLLQADTPVITIFGKTWDLHVTDVLNTTLEENLKMISETIKYFKNHGKEVVFDAEHFFDGFKNNSQYAYKCLETAQKAGVDWIILADTNGGSTIEDVDKTTRYIKEKINTPLGIHAHNDMDLAVANSITAVKNGFTQVQGTMNGFGERCGNANLISIMPILSFKMNYETISQHKLTRLTEFAHSIYDIANIPPNDNQPFVGKNAFAHKGGVHAHAIIKDPSSYEQIKPEKVGNYRSILVSNQAGISSLIYKAEKMGIELNKQNPQTRDLLLEIKNLEGQGYEFENADASLKLLILKKLNLYKDYFILDDFRVIIETKSKEIYSEAIIKITVNQFTEHTAAVGNGPVNALDNALRKALVKFYPCIKESHLVDYKVRVMEGSSGTSAKVKVFIETADAKEVWTTVGVSTNIIEASWLALVDSIEYKLFKEKQDIKNIQCI